MSKFYLTGISDNKDITNVFDFDNFYTVMKFDQILQSKNTLLNALVVALRDGFHIQATSSMATFMDVFPGVLFQQSFNNTFLPAIAAQNPVMFNANKPTQVAALQNSLVLLVTNSAVDFSSMSSIQPSLMNLPDKAFAFGQSFVGIGDTFDVSAFKTNITQVIMDSFYTYFYYIHVQKEINACGDFKCKRAYLLAQYVFVYYTLMSLFLRIFSNANTVQQFATDTTSSNADLEALKYELVLMMDGVLARLQDENLMDVPGAQNISTLNKYYNKLKAMSAKNVQTSSDLNDEKTKAKVMQNNLGNFTSTELLAMEDLNKMKLVFLISVVAVGLVIAMLVYFLLSGNYMALNVTAAVVLLSIAIYGLVGAIRQ